jgi:hypothetical protein
MTVTVKVLIPRKQAENAETTQYTATNCKTVIDKCTVTNTTAGSVAFTVKLVAFGGSPGVANIIISAKSIAAGECYTCPEMVGQALEPGGFISTLAGSAASLTISASGREIT